MTDEKENSQPKSKSQKMKTAGKEAQAKSDQEKTSVQERCPLKDNHWIEVQLVGEDGSCIRNEKCTIIAPDGKDHRGKTDAKGMLRVEGIPEGQCRVTFPYRDPASWEPDPKVEPPPMEEPEEEIVISA